MTEATAPSGATSAAQPAQPPKNPQFPPHNAPRVWFLTNGSSAVSINLARYLLAHGDYVVTAVSPVEIDKEERRARDFGAFLEEVRRQGPKDKSKGNGPASEPGDVSSAVDTANGDDDEQPMNGKASNGGMKQKPWRERIRVVPLEGSSVSQAQAGVAEAQASFGLGIDIVLLTTPAAVVGTVEELGQTAAAQTLVREQFEANFFANVNLIKAVLPSMRKRKNGHLVLLSGITGHLGTPGLATHCASQWAMEGYCDSLAFEIAPFNVKMTIVQPNIEIGMLTNKITSVPPMAEYEQDANPAPLWREKMSSLLDKLEGAVPPEETVIDRRRSYSQYSGGATSGILGASSPDALEVTETPISESTATENPEFGLGYTSGDLLYSQNIASVYPPLSMSTQSLLVQETVFALAAIGGHDNPPARHIVGFEGIASVKEKLNNVSRELEDFIEASGAVDFPKEDGSAG